LAGKRRSMQLNFAVVVALGSFGFSLVASWYAWRAHRHLTTLTKFEAARDLKLKQLYRERVQKEYPEQVSKVKAEFAARGQVSSGQCKKALAELKSTHERELGMIDADIAYFQQVLNA